jgi:hypothetical protein
LRTCHLAKLKSRHSRWGQQNALSRHDRKCRRIIVLNFYQEIVLLANRFIYSAIVFFFSGVSFYIFNIFARLTITHSENT